MSSKQAKKTFRVWFRSLGIAVVGGMMSEMSAWIFDPHTMFDNPKAVGARLLTGAGIAVYNYWKRSPITDVWPEEDDLIVLDSDIPAKKDA